jgi:digeranylgeranylglycerophospholipid reductase
MTNDVSVAIVGAGPAGIIAAHELQDNDIDFVLFERDSAPGKSKVCGGFLPQKAIEEFDIGTIDRSRPIHEIRIKFPGNEIRSVQFDSKVGINASRESIGKALLKLTDLREDNIYLDTSVEQIAQTNTGLRIEFSKKEVRESLTVDVLIDASGVNPISGRFLPVRARIPNERMGYAIQYHLEGSKIELESNDFYYGSEFSPGGYAWVFPRNESVVAGSGGLVERIRAEKSQITKYLDYLVTVGLPAKFDLEGLQVVKQEAALMPLAGIFKPSFTDRVLLVGDAAGHCSPISGEGIHYAMRAGRFAGEAVARALLGKQVNPQYFIEYEKRWIKSFGSDLKWGLWLQKRILREGSQSLGSKLLSSPNTSQIIAEMLVGRRSVKSTILKALPGYIRSKI